MPSTPISPRRQSSFSSANSLPSSNHRSRHSTSRIHPNFRPMIRQLRAPLTPLISCSTGETPPQFPPTLLAYHLLTSNQLDALARHFHQVWPPMPQTSSYPVRIPAWLGTPQEAAVDLETKRRRFGRFIGLRDCESPTGERTFFRGAFEVNVNELARINAGQQLHSIIEEPVQMAVDEDAETVMQMLAQMESEWQEALQQAREEQDSRFFGKS